MNKLSRFSIVGSASTKLQSFFFPPVDIHADSTLNHILDEIRGQLITTLLRFSFILGIPAVITGSITLFKDQYWLPLITGNVALIIIGVLAFKSTINHKIRSAIFLGLAYLFALSSILTAIDEVVFAALMVLLVLATLLLGRLGGSIVAILKICTVAFAHWLLINDVVPFASWFIGHDITLTFLLGSYTAWVFYIGIVMFTLWVFVDGFNIAWTREQHAKKLLDQERLRLMEGLSREQLLMSEVEQSYQRQQELSQLQSEMITTVSHEFRTPLTVIKTSVDLLKRYGRDIRPEKQQQLHGRIDEAISYISELLNDASLVNIASSGNIIIDSQKISLTQFCHSLKNDLLNIGNQPDRLRFDFELDENRLIQVDYVYLKQVVENLVTNALKYSDDSTPVLISIDLSDVLQVKITDQGVGIPTQDVNKIWDLFYRGSNVETQRGLGLGLHIAKQLMTEMGGTISVESAGEGQGSCFTLTIPQPDDRI